MKKIFKHLKIVFIAMVLLWLLFRYFFNLMASASFSDPQPSVQTTGRVELVYAQLLWRFSMFSRRRVYRYSLSGSDDKDWKKANLMNMIVITAHMFLR